MWIRGLVAGISLVLVSMTPDMEAAKTASLPGPEHKQLESLAGTWDVGVKMWMNPKIPPMESKGTSVIEWILDGRFVRHTFTGQFMGVPYEGRGLIGYDNIEKEYFNIWIDVLSTSVLHELGSYNAATQELTFTGEFKDPMGRKVKSRQTVKIVSHDQHQITRYETHTDGKERKMMEMTYSRSKAPATP